MTTIAANSFPLLCALCVGVTTLGGCSLLFDASRSIDSDAASIDARPCGIGLDDTIAYYIVDGDGDKQFLNDSFGDNTAVVRTEESNQLVPANLETADGPSTPCGEAVRFNTLDPAFVSIPSNSFQEVASFDFWFKMDSVTSEEQIGALLAKDRRSATDGDMILFVYESNNEPTSHHVILRLQKSLEDQYYACSDSIAPRSWNHVGVSFGGNTGVKLFVNGNEANNDALELSSPGFFFSDSAECHRQGSAEFDAEFNTLESNTHDWLWGASNHRDGDIEGSIVASEFLDGAVDELRFRSEELSQSQALDVYESVLPPL